MASVPLGETSNGNLTGESPDPGGAPAAEDWYFKVIGEELGPFRFDEVVSFAEQGYLSAAAEVKVGVSGIWSRVDSVARLVAVLPPEISPPASPPKEDREIPPVQATPPSDCPVAPVEIEKSSVEPVSPPPGSPSAVEVPAEPVVKSADEQAAELELLEAQTAHTAIELAMNKLIASAFGKNQDKAWWGWVGGTEYGPVDFAQLVKWVAAGRLRPTDLVRFGAHAQYTLVGTVPGLLHAASITGQTTELLVLTISRVMPRMAPVVKLSQPTEVGVPPKIVSTSTSASTSISPSDSKTSVPPTDADSQTTVQPAPPFKPTRTRKSVGTSSPSANSSAGGKSAKSRASSEPLPISLELVMEYLTEWSTDPRVISAAIVLLFSLFLLGQLVGWLRTIPPYSTADIARCKELRTLLADLKSNRAANATDYSELKARAEKMKKTFTPILEKEADIKHPAKQSLLWAVRDVLPRLMKQDLKVESKAERDFTQRLDDAEKLMKLRK